MNVSVAEVLAGAAAHAVPLTAECVGYLVLGAADQVIGAPRCVGAGDLLLSEDGVVRVAGGRAAPAEDAERDLRALLDALLLRASSASAGLLRASRRPAGSGIPGLVRELETALIPVNRAAAKRSLARLQRETCRALESGRIRFEESAPAPVVAAAPVVVSPVPVPVPVPAMAVPTPAPASVTPAPAVVAEDSSSEPLPSVALPPVLPPPPSVFTPVPVTAEQRDQTVILAEVAPRALVPPEPPQLVETRPEPVVQRASQRPTARPPAEPAETVKSAEPNVLDPGHTLPLPPVTVAEPVAVAEPAVTVAEPVVTVAPVVVVSPPVETPVLGTRFFIEQDASKAPLVVEAGASDDDDLEIVVIEEPRAVEMAAEDDDDGLIEVIFEEDDRTVFPDDRELHYVDTDARDTGETTDPCPALAAESMLPPQCEVVTAAPPSDVAPVIEAELEPPPVAQASEPSSKLPPVAPRAEAHAPELVESEVEPASVPELVAGEVEVPASEPELAASNDVEVPASEPELVASEVELAALVESALPPWSCEEAPAFEVTPPPRVALPVPRKSDVQDLLLQLGQAPLGIDDLRTGLKRLAGLDLTPPPPGTAVGE